MWHSWLSIGKRLEQPSQHSLGFTESTQLPKPTWSEPSVSASAPFRYAVEHRNSLIGWHFVSVAKDNRIKDYCYFTFTIYNRVKIQKKKCVWRGVWYASEVHTCTLTPTQDSDVCIGFLRRICVELAHIASLVGEWHIGQRHPQFVVREIHQLEPAVLQSCWDTGEAETVRIQSTGTPMWDTHGRLGRWGSGEVVRMSEKIEEDKGASWSKWDGDGRWAEGS